MLLRLIAAWVVFAVFFQVTAQNKAPEAAAAKTAPAVSMIADEAKPEIVYEAKAFFEGPAWDKASGKLFFTAFGKENGKAFQRIMRLEDNGKATLWMDNSGGVNGMFMADDGRLLGAQHMKHKVLSMAIGDKEPAEIKILAEDDNWMQPNDICQASNGNIYFTDPDFKQRKKSKVYLLKPDGKVTPIISDMAVPNGVILSPDGKTLYVSDSFKNHWRAYPVLPDGTVGPGKLFFQPDTKNTNSPDGMTVDEKGNLYLTGRGGIWIVAPDGKLLQFIEFKEFCSNCAFGGEDNKTLFITASGKVFALKMKNRGLR